MFFNMKPQFAAVFLSVAALSMQIEAAPSRIEARRSQMASRSPSTAYKKDDTLELLRKLSSQVREMQDQIGHLKAAQNSLSSDSMVRNLSPKIRKMEMQVEYLEKKVRDFPSYNEFKKLLNDCEQLKGQLDNNQSADSSSEDALSALTPVINRMQKQIVYLYQKHKAQEGENYSLLEEKCAGLHKEMEAVLTTVKNQQKALNQKLAQFQQERLQQINEELNPKFDLIKKQIHALYQRSKKAEEEYSGQSSQVASFKTDLDKQKAILGEFYKNIKALKEQTEGLSGSFAQQLGDMGAKITALQGSVEKFDSTDLNSFDSKINTLNRQVVCLYKNVRGLKQSSEQVSNALEKQVQIDEKLASLESMKVSIDEKMGQLNNQVGYLYKNFKELKQSGEQVSNALEKQAQMDEKLASLESMKMSIDEKMAQLNSQVGYLYKNFKELKQSSEQISNALEKQAPMDEKLASIENMKASIEHLQAEIANFPSVFTQKLSDMESKYIDLVNGKADEAVVSGSLVTLKKQIGYLYQGFKEIKSSQNIGSSLDTLVKEKLASLEEIQKKTSELNEKLSQRIAALEGRKDNSIVAGGNKDSTVPLELVRKQIAALHKSYNELNEKVHHLSDAYTIDNAKTALIEKLSQEVALLKKELSDSQSTFKSVKDLDEKIVQLQRQNAFLYNKLSQENTKADAVSSTEDNTHVLQKLSELSEKVENLSTPTEPSELSSRNVEEELKKRDDEISKLKRRVMYLYSKSRESIDNQDSEALADKFNVMRDELEARIMEQLKSAKKDQQIIDSLLEKVASLEEALKVKEDAKEDSLTKEGFQG